MRLYDELERYLVAKRQEGLADTSLFQYRWHLVRLLEWLDGRPPSRDLLREWGAGLRDRWSPATVRTAVIAARGLFAWLVEEGCLVCSPADGLKTPRVPARVQRTLEAGEIRRMLDVCDDSPKGLRDGALINVLVDTGLRASEVCRLCVSDLCLDGLMLVVVVKGGQQRMVFYNECTAMWLRKWLGVRCAVAGVGSVFVSVGGARPGCALTARGLRVILKRVGECAGVLGVCPHAFRRAFAVISTRLGAPTRVVQLEGGWSDTRQVERYTRSLAAGTLHQRWSPAEYVNSLDVGDDDP